MLIGQRICLGPLFKEDAQLLFNWRNQLSLMRLDGLYRPVSEASFEEWFGGIGRDPARVFFAIRRATDLAFIGYVQIVNIHPVIRSAELGIMIGELAERGRGYGQEALRLVVGFCWDELNLQRLYLMVTGHNPSAVHAYNKVGFVQEGLLRRSNYVGGELRDVTIMALLREQAH